MKYKHVIWDYNGTLLNDIHVVVEVMNQLLDARSLPLLTIDRYRRVFDFPVKEYYRKLGFNFEEEAFEVSGMEFIRKYDSCINQVELKPGILAVLSTFRERGIAQSVLSARNQKQLREEINYLGISPFFFQIRGLSDDFAAGKADIGKQLMSEILLPEEEIILIGDTTHDYDVAQTLGIDCLLVTDGHQSKEKLAKLTQNLADDPDRILHTVLAHSGDSAKLNL